MRTIKWMLGGFAVASVAMIALMVYDAVARDGGSGSWILAGIWFLGMILISGVVLRSVANR